MDYTFNFSWKGLLIFALAMLPNLYYFKTQKKEAQIPDSINRLLDVLEHSTQIIFIFLLIFIVNKKDSSFHNPVVILIVTFLLMYYGLWIFYIMNIKHIIMIEGLAIVPVLYFLASEYWLHNYIAMIPTLIFGVIHSIITYKNYKLNKHL